MIQKKIGNIPLRRTAQSALPDPEDEESLEADDDISVEAVGNEEDDYDIEEGMHLNFSDVIWLLELLIHLQTIRCTKHCCGN